MSFLYSSNSATQENVEGLARGLSYSQNAQPETIRKQNRRSRIAKTLSESIG